MEEGEDTEPIAYPRPKQRPLDLARTDYSDRALTGYKPDD